MIRTEKRRAIDAEGKPLFKPRRTEMLPVAWNERHADQERLYEAVTTYVQEGYNQAMREKRNYIGFLMILMQRLVTSSTQAIRTALENRLAALQEPEAQMTFFDTLDAEEWNDLDGQDQLDTLIRTRFKALRNEQDEVRVLLNAAKQVEHAGPDAKAEALLNLLYKLQQEEGDPELKVLLFTEFVPTQKMLASFFEERGISTVKINGSMSIDARLRAQRQFAGETRVLISTDAGGEGLNLQFCHVVVNYDMPWNPMRLVQRRIREQLGERETVSRAARRIYRSFIDWEVLSETGTKGIYAKSPPLRISDSHLVAWLFECILHLNGTGWTPTASLDGHPSLFPFAIHTSAREALQGRPRLESMRHGMDQEMVRIF